jgi:hypothetical protein
VARARAPGLARPGAARIGARSGDRPAGHSRRARRGGHARSGERTGADTPTATGMRAARPRRPSRPGRLRRRRIPRQAPWPVRSRLRAPGPQPRPGIVRPGNRPALARPWPGRAACRRPGGARPGGASPGARRPSVAYGLPGLRRGDVRGRVGDGEHRVARIRLRIGVGGIVTRSFAPPAARRWRARPARAGLASICRARVCTPPVPGGELAGRVHRRRLAGSRRIPAHRSLARRGAVPRRIPGPAIVPGYLTRLSPAGVAGHEDRLLLRILTGRMLAGIAAAPTAPRLVCGVVGGVTHSASVSPSGRELAC